MANFVMDFLSNRSTIDQVEASRRQLCDCAAPKNWSRPKPESIKKTFITWMKKLLIFSHPGTKKSENLASFFENLKIFIFSKSFLERLGMFLALSGTPECPLDWTAHHSFVAGKLAVCLPGGHRPATRGGEVGVGYRYRYEGLRSRKSDTKFRNSNFLISQILFWERFGMFLALSGAPERPWDRPGTSHSNARDTQRTPGLGRSR